MKKLAVLLLLTVAPALPQSNQDVIKDIPKPSECVAAINTWFAPIQTMELDTVRRALKDIPANTLLERQEYLMACKDAYPQMNKSGASNMMSALETIITAYNMEANLRMQEFLVKHRLLDQFYAEDAKARGGK